MDEKSGCVRGDKDSVFFSSKAIHDELEHQGAKPSALVD